MIESWENVEEILADGWATVEEQQEALDGWFCLGCHTQDEREAEEERGRRLVAFATWLAERP